ncbi:MAG: DUF362 domain-containing protein [Planctomycetia bacterium]|nr:DUF362 domain-containing protein [Planctomycetia bacterium]
MNQNESPEDVSNVYFTTDLSAAGMMKLYQKVNQNISGKVGIKLHTGEKNGPNILPREWVQEFQAQVPNSAIVETNTLYHGDRFTTEGHRETLKVNGWTFCPVDIMDEPGEVAIPVKGGQHLKELHVGKNMLNYDSMIVLTHFKGHIMGGFGGSCKNIAIGCASGHLGKAEVHGFKLKDAEAQNWAAAAHNALFMELMADSAKAICDFFEGRICFINVLRRMSVDCDCVGVEAEEPKCRDIGILASTDVLAVDQASIDMVYQLPENELHDLKERIESNEGLHQLTSLEKLNVGNRKYQIIEL